jgi:myo-inositol-1(or 4)-monophosphatase
LTDQPPEVIPMTDESLLETARRAAARAASVQSEARGTVDPANWTVKGRSDFTTEVDRESERVIVQTLLEVFPDHRIFAEEGTESAADGGQPPALWIIERTMGMASGRQWS